MTKAIAIIPARGGSKRLPRKNIADFMGKPIIAWTIEAAKESGVFERIVVSTEDAEIAETSERYGADVDPRDPALATDAARETDVMLELLSREERDGKYYDITCCLYATAPLRRASDIKAVINLLEPGKCDFALAATNYDLPPHQALKLGADNAVTPMWPDLVNMVSSAVGHLVVDNGSTYAVSTEEFKKTGSFYGPNLKVHMMPRELSQDIDEQIDLDLARYFAEKMKDAA